MGSDHGFDRVFSALRRVVASTDRLQNHVAEVAQSIDDLNRESFPGYETWELFQVLLAEYASRAAQGDEKAIPASTPELSDEEATGWLQRALGLFAEIAESHGRQNP